MGDKLIVIRVDGGICSQINFAAYGLFIANQNNDFSVKYDLSWFRKNGKDFNGNFVRTFDLLKCCPDLPFEEAIESEITEAKKNGCRDLSVTPISDVRSACYLKGYPPYCFDLPDCRQILRRYFHPQFDAEAQSVFVEICQTPSCAVHVRRGDLSTFFPAYGYPCSSDYFRKAIAIVRALEPNVRFFFFSDEPDYVRNELLPSLPQDINAQIVCGNGSEKGYVDLALIAGCRHIIASIGSFGMFGAFLGDIEGVCIVPRCIPQFFKSMRNVIYLNEDQEFLSRPTQAECRKRLMPGVYKIRRGHERTLSFFDRITVKYRKG